MKVLVTGAGGFVGRHLVPHLEAEGDEVVTLAEGIDVTELEALRQAIDAARPDGVYHLAGYSHPGESWNAPVEVFRVNAGGTLNVLLACQTAGVGRVLVVGSADEYGVVRPDDLPLSEDAELRPVTPYAASKVAAEFLALQAHLGSGLGTIRVRAFNHTGPGQSDRFVVPALAHRIAQAELAGEHTLPVGSLDPVRDFTDVRDIVRAYRLLLEGGEAGEVYNVCSGVGVSISEVVDHLLAAARIDLSIETDPSLVRPVEIPRLVGDNTRLRGATGWKPEIPLDVTLAEVLESFRKEPDPAS